MAKPSNNPAYNQTMQQLKANNAVQIAKAAQLDAAYRQSKTPIVPARTGLKDAKKLSYRPGASANEDWTK